MSYSNLSEEEIAVYGLLDDMKYVLEEQAVEYTVKSDPTFSSMWEKVTKALRIINNKSENDC